ncbi:MAG: hypothetical protein ACFFD2_16250 [Promethearchaeota archaeon]
MNSSSIKIGFDVTQKERGRIFSNYQGVRTILEREQFSYEEITEFPITLPLLQNYNIVVFACPDGSRLIQEEIAALLQLSTSQ